MESDLQKRLDEALLLLEQQRKETSLQSFKVAELSRRLLETEKNLADEHRKLEETRIELSKALSSLAEHKSIDEKLGEFDKELKKVETMKRNYEKRISELESRLGDAKKRLGEADDRELGESIDMLEAQRQRALTIKRNELNRMKREAQANRIKAPTPPPLSATEPEPTPEPSPLLSDKISGTPAETANKVSAYLNSLSHNKKRARRADDDWLSDLPDL